MANAAQTLDTAEPATDFSSWTREEIRDLIAEAISDSLDMDWQPSWGADAVLRALDDARLSVQHDLPALVEAHDLLNISHVYHGGVHKFHDYTLQWGAYDNRLVASGRTLELAFADKRLIDSRQVAA